MDDIRHHHVELSFAERRDWLRLIRTEHIGPATFGQLIQRFGTAAEALAQLPSLSGGKRSFKTPPVEHIEAEFEIADRLGAHFIASCEAAYPAPLHAIHDTPPILCVCGDVSLFQKPAIAIVGARNASSAGKKIAANLATDLGREGLVVISGLARGIDGAAHVAALEFGTIAVVAGGVDVIYPPEHAELTQQIAADGLILSEAAPGYKPKGRDFPRRNRIISGLSQGVIVVEAAQKSGTLITVRFALEQGRDVFAVPGSPLDPRSRGTNQLLRNGAILVESVDDVLEHVRLQASAPISPTGFFSDETPVDLNTDDILTHREQVRCLLSFTPMHRDDLIRGSDLSTSEVSHILLELVLAGDAEEHTGGKYTLRSDR